MPTTVDGELLLDQADDPVVVAPTAVDHAEPVALAVVEQEEVVTHEFHLQQGLVDRHRPGGVDLLAQQQRAVALHLDRDHGTVRLGPVEPVVLVVQFAGARPGYAVAVERRCRERRRHLLVRHQGGRAQRHVVVLVDLAPVGGPAEAVFEFGEGEIQRRVPVVGGRLGPDRGAAGPDGQFDALTAIRLPRVAFLGDLHIDPYRLLVKLLELGELGGGVLTETRRDGYVASADDDFHHDPLPVRLRPIWSTQLPWPRFRLSWIRLSCVRLNRVALARPTWSSTPHSPAEGVAASWPLVPFSRPGRLCISRRGRSYS